MATLDKKISEFTAATSLSDTSQAFLALVDETESVASNRNKKMTVDNFKTALNIQGGMNANEKANQNNLIKDVARLNYANSLNAIDYKGGSYDIFADESKIASSSQVVVSTLDGGDPNGKVELDEDITGWVNLNSATYASKSASVSSESTLPRGLAFNADKTKMYVLEAAGNAIYQYTLSTAGDVTTLSYDSISFSTSGQTSFPTGLAISADGTKFYVTDSSSIYQYTMSTAWNIGTGSYDSISLSVSSGISGIYFRADGLRFYTTFSNNIVEYSLATAYANITTSTFISQTLINAQDNAITDLFFKSDGTKMYLLGNQNDRLYQYSLGTAWDSSDFTYDSQFLSVASQETNPNAVWIDSIGLQCYVVGQVNDTVYQYNVGTSAGFFTSGNFVTTTIDLTADLASNPTSVVVSSEFVTPTDTTLSVVISDGTPANDVTVTSANFDTEVDCSSLTSRTLTLTWNLGTSNTSVTPTLNNYGVYFS